METLTRNAGLDRTTARFRGLAILVAALGAILAVLAFFPGYEILEDANNCNSVREFFGGHHCVRNYVPVSTDPVASPVLAVMTLVTAGAGLWFGARRRAAWFGVAFASTVIAIIAQFAAVFHLFEHTRTLPVADLFAVLYITFLILTLVALPIAAFGTWIIRRRR